MNATTIVSASVELFDIPFRRPFVTALGRKDSTRNAAISIRLKNGASGYGEASSSLAGAHRTPEALLRTLRKLGDLALGDDALDLERLSSRAWKAAPEAAPAVAAFESALVSAAAAASGMTQAARHGGAVERIESDITLSALDQESTRAAAAEAWAMGFRVFKVKVGGDPSDDLSRVMAAHEASGRRARIIIDGNQGMTRGGALRFLERLSKKRIPVILLEQPLLKTDLKGMAFVTRRSAVPVAADESVATPEEALRVADCGAASVINLKLAKSGLVRGLRICTVARAAGLGLMIGCMAESARGLASSVHLALGTGFFRFVDLDTDVLLKGARGDCGWVRRGRFLSCS